MMRNSTTVRIINLGADAHRKSWTAVAGRSRFEQVALLVLAVLLGIPLLLILLGIGAVVLIIGSIIGLGMAAVLWLKRRFRSGPGSTAEGAGRENVRVVQRGPRG